MGRKNLLQGLMTPPPEAPADPPAPPHAPSPSPRGAIGAVSRSIAELKARAVIEIDPFQIDAGGVQDRLESDSADDDALARSLRDYGQQVPVLVRPHPDGGSRYQIVYGRRRVLAMRDLGLPVKALVRDMDDRELVLAQGQENTARRDLSFIEKANFARQMTEAGYDRRIVCDALSVDKTVISRMLTVMDQIPLAVIEAIGAAPSVGRDRWIALGAMLAGRDDDEGALIAMLALGAKAGGGSDARFQALADYVSGSRKRRADHDRRVQTTDLTDDNGGPIARARRGDRKTVIEINTMRDDGFADWLLSRIPDIHRRWRDGEDPA